MEITEPKKYIDRNTLQMGSIVEQREEIKKKKKRKSEKRVEFNQSEQQRKPTEHKQMLRNLWDSNKRTIICIIRVPEGNKKREQD